VASFACRRASGEADAGAVAGRAVGGGGAAGVVKSRESVTGRGSGRRENVGRAGRRPSGRRGPGASVGRRGRQPRAAWSTVLLSAPGEAALGKCRSFASRPAPRRVPRVAPGEPGPRSAARAAPRAGRRSPIRGLDLRGEGAAPGWQPAAGDGSRPARGRACPSPVVRPPGTRIGRGPPRRGRAARQRVAVSRAGVPPRSGGGS